MKVIESYNLEHLVSEYDFEPFITDDDRLMFDSDHELITESGDGYIKAVADGRRGQSYYLYISIETREVEIYSSSPDGAGIHGVLDYTLFNMITDGTIE